MDKKKVIRSPIYFIRKEINLEGNVIEVECSQEDANKVCFSDEVHTIDDIKSALEKYEEDAPVKRCPISFFKDVHLDDGSIYRQRCLEIKAHNSRVELEDKDSCYANNEIICAKQKEAISKVDNSLYSNFAINPISREIEVDNMGNVKDGDEVISFEVIVFLEHGKEKTKILDISAKNINNIVKIISRRIPEAIFDFRLEKEIINDFRRSLSHLDEIEVRYVQGWNRVRDNMVYLTQNRKLNGIKVRIEPDLPDDKTVNKAVVIDKIMNLISVKEKSAILLIFTMLGVGFELFRQAGYPIRFILFLEGKTGSYKTAISKVLFHQLMPNDKRDLPRKLDLDTSASLDVALTEGGKDTVTLIDDLHPSVSRSDQRKTEAKLELIQRISGEGSGKNRSDGHLKDKRSKGLSGVVVITGEFKGNGVQSSFLRTLYLRIIKDEVNLEALSFLQNGFQVTSLIWDFILYLEKNWNSVCAYIRQSFPILRKEIQSNGLILSSRITDTFITLILMFRIYRKYAVKILQYIGFTNDEWISEIETGILRIVTENDGDNSELDPVKLFMRAFFEMIETKEFILSSERLTKENVASFDGFYDDAFFYIKVNHFYAKVKAWLAKGDFFDDGNRDELIRDLADDGFISKIKNGKKANGEQRFQNLLRLPIGSVNENGIVDKVSFVKIPRNVKGRVFE